MKILVTGGAGFIGSNFIYYLLENRPEYEIVCLDKLTYAGNLKTLDSALKNDRFTFVKGDIADRNFVDSLFENHKFDIVVNFAAESHVDRSIEHPEVFLQTNIMGQRVFLTLRKNTGLKDIIRYQPMRFTVICRLKELICSLRKKLPFIHQARIPPPRHRLICLLSLITEHINFL